MRRLFIVAILLCCSPRARAEDAGAVIASMKTEAEECRYVLDTCKRVRFNREQLKRESPDGAINSDARVRWDFLRSLAEADEERLRAALRVMRTKHSRRPKCLDECKDLGA